MILKEMGNNEPQKFFRWLKEHHIYDRWVYNTANRPLHWKIRTGSIKELVVSAFKWNGTPEGYSFWEWVAYKYCSYKEPAFLWESWKNSALLQKYFPEFKRP